MFCSSHPFGHSVGIVAGVVAISMSSFLIARRLNVNYARVDGRHAHQREIIIHINGLFEAVSGLKTTNEKQKS